MGQSKPKSQSGITEKMDRHLVPPMPVFNPGTLSVPDKPIRIPRPRKVNPSEAEDIKDVRLLGDHHPSTGEVMIRVNIKYKKGAEPWDMDKISKYVRSRLGLFEIVW